MNNEKSLNDYVVNGSENDLTDAIKEMRKKFTNAEVWISKNIPRTNDSLAMHNLLKCSTQYIDVLATSINQHISILALATRSLYELNLQVRLICSDPKNIQTWYSEVITDKIQVIEGILGIQTISEMSPQRVILRNEIQRLNDLRIKHNLQAIKSPASAGEIAKQLGLSQTHKNLYKLFSKIVHPSSYIVNDYNNAASPQNTSILQIHAQLYAWDTLNRIASHFTIPDNIIDHTVAS